MLPPTTRAPSVSSPDSRISSAPGLKTLAAALSLRGSIMRASCGATTCRSPHTGTSLRKRRQRSSGWAVSHARTPPP